MEGITQQQIRTEPRLRDETHTPHIVSGLESSDRNPFLATTTSATVLATTSPFFTAVLDLANGLEPITDDTDLSDDTSEESLAPRKANPSRTSAAATSMRHLQRDSDGLGDVPAMKQGREAKDVQPFIHKNGESKECKLCMCVTSKYFIFAFIFDQYHQRQV